MFFFREKRHDIILLLNEAFLEYPVTHDAIEGTRFDHAVPIDNEQ